MSIKQFVINVFVFQFSLVACSGLATAPHGTNRTVPLFSENPQEIKEATVVDSPGGYADFLNEHHLSELDVPFLRTAKRFRIVTINAQAIQPHALMEGMILRLDVFHDVTVQARIDTIEQDMNGVSAVIAQVEDSESGYVLLSIANGKILGSISLPKDGQEFQLNAVQGISMHIIQEIDPARKDELMPGPPLIPPDVH